MLKKYFLSLFLLLLLPQNTIAQEHECVDRYLTLVNPIRGRNVWFDEDSENLDMQYELVENYGLSATWLLTYDAIADEKIIETISGFNESQEIGLFLEVTPKLAKDSGVIYPHAVEWYDPNAVFLSGYDRAEREKLIDTLFKQFKTEFGVFPDSVGAWWIDSYSAEYITENYGVQIAMIVADQKTTDSYGVWGQWWGVPYIAKTQNILVPERSPGKYNLAIIQWAQRDLARAYGEGPEFSNYSLQANDYTERGLNTDYFKELTNTYLDCSLPVGQITVGLETGQEGLLFINEYKNQLDYLSDVDGLQSVTMSEFASLLKEKWDEYPNKIVLTDGDSEWKLGFDKRENSNFGDSVNYSENSFSDYFVRDKSEFLDRKLSNLHTTSKEWISFYILPFILSFVFFNRQKRLLHWLLSTVFVLLSFTPLFRSYYEYGWVVYFGPMIDNLIFVQLLLVTLIYLAAYYLAQKKNVSTLLLFSVISTFAVDFFIRIPKYTSLDGIHHIGFTTNMFNFYGIALGKDSFRLISMDLPSTVAGSLLRFNYQELLTNKLAFFVLSPALHILIGMVLYFVFKKIRPKYRNIILVASLLFALVHLYYLLNLDPVSVEAL